MQSPRRKDIRLRNYDYAKEGMYFITICTKNRKELLSFITFGSVKTDPYIKLSNIGKITEQNLIEIKQHFKAIKIHDYIIMPNHVHFIIEKISVGAGLDQPRIRISDVIGLFKSGVSRQLGYSIWQRNYYEHIIRNEKEYLEILEYIQNNPLKWKEDKYYKKEAF